MNNITFSDSVLIFFLESYQWCYCIFYSRLYLDRINFIFQFAVIWKYKIYFYIIAVFLIIIMRIKIQFMPICRQHLGNDVFIHSNFQSRSLEYIFLFNIIVFSNYTHSYIYYNLWLYALLYHSFWLYAILIELIFLIMRT